MKAKTTINIPSKNKINSLVGKTNASGSATSKPAMSASDQAARIDQLEAQLALLMSVVSVDQSGNVTISSAGNITINASTSLELQANAYVEVGTNSAELKIENNGNFVVSAVGKISLDSSLTSLNTANLNVSAPMSEFSGIIKTDSIIADSVIGKSYAPGAGNVW